MDTFKNVAEQQCVIASGFVRLAYKKKTIPKDIIRIICHYFAEYFEWNDKENEHGAGLSFSNELNRNSKATYISVTCDSRITNVSCFARNVIDSKKHKRVDWEITLNDFMPEKLCFSIGYVKYPALEYITLSNFLGNDVASKGSQYSVYLEDWKIAGSTRTVLHGGQHWVKNISNAQKFKIGKGDRFRVVFDMENKKSFLYINDVLYSHMYDNIPDKIVPAMSFAYMHVCTCTQWQIVYKTYYDSN